MNIRTLLLILPLLFLLVACGDGSPFSGPSQTMKVTLELGQVELISEFANNPKSPMWKNIIGQTRQTMADGEADAVTAFAQAWEKRAEGRRMITFFYNRAWSGLFEKEMSNEEVLQTLRSELENAADMTQAILEKRMENFGASGTVKHISGTGRFEVEISSGAPLSSVRRLLTSTAALELNETYELSELVDMLAMIDNVYGTKVQVQEPEIDTVAIMTSDDWGLDELTTDSPATEALLSADVGADQSANAFFEVFQVAIPFDDGMYNYPKGCLVGLCDVRDTAKVNSMLKHKEVIAAAPADLMLMWGAHAEQNYGLDERDGTYFGLYAVKRSRGSVMNANDIADARSDFDDQTNAPEVRCMLTLPGSERFADLTGKNIKRAIAIVVDGQVWSAPIVHEKIEGGAFTINGQTDLNECYELATLLRTGSLPAPLRIVSEKIVS